MPVQEIDRALRAPGWSARYASTRAAGSPQFITQLRSGSLKSLAKFRTLCEILGLEFYVGSPREMSEIDEQRLEAVDRALAEGVIPVELDLRLRARLVVAVYALVGQAVMPANRSPVLARVTQLIHAMTGARRRFSDSPGA